MTHDKLISQRDTTAGNGRSSRNFRSILQILAVPLILVIAGLAMSIAVTTQHSDALSPSDEWVYVDYLHKFPHQGLVRQGEPIGQESLELMACSGVRAYGPMGPPCGGPYDDISDFPFGGVTSAYGYTPLYFAPTWLAATAIDTITSADFLTSARLTGAIWLALTMITLYWMFREFRVKRLVALALGLCFIGSPYSWWRYTYVTTDAPTVAITALMLIMALRFLRGRMSGWWLVPAGTLAMLFKPSNILTVGLIAVFLLIEAGRRWRQNRPTGISLTWRAFLSGPGPEHLVGVAAAMVIASGVAQFLWLQVQKAIAVGLPADQGQGRPLTVADIFSQAVNFLPDTIVSNVVLYGTNTNSYAIPASIVEPLSWLTVAGVAGGIWMLSRRNSNASIISAIAISAVAFAPLLALMLQLTLGEYYEIPARYGAPVLAGFLLAAGLTAQNRWVSYLVLTYGTALVIYVTVRAPVFA
ncbi:glycosyltransferase family 39 protein [Cryobacterium sp. TMT2-15-1]|uniref:ArnT family glycosyltransferase n=1 Tax=Cryobacterium sp. TMT2-15-1 TaxID=1259246 RepID=UPI00141B97F9|nr:glycosyltransferase family 39 protein [Cryobacterium sp. TMT2-15-1]